uniref:Putative secreted peptide n=1 Tax=Anopheles braziliensis TaxID=58242 RepID=A0A2M3ZWX0_9DIPT
MLRHFPMLLVMLLLRFLSIFPREGNLIFSHFAFIYLINEQCFAFRRSFPAPSRCQYDTNGKEGLTFPGR